MNSERLSLVLCFLVMVNFTSLLSVEAYRFVVGGKDGWTLKPSENYNHWAERMRFQVNDTLSFKYSKGSDSVLVVVSKDDYDKCNTGNPIVKFDDGDSTFKFDKSGPFYFISGNKSNCDQGQKLVIIVLAIRNFPKPAPIAPTPATPTPSAAPTPTPASSSPSPYPSVLAPSPSPSVLAPSPSPSVLTPSPSPSVLTPSPSPSVLTPSPSPSVLAPSPSPVVLAPAPSPLSNGPVMSPAPKDSPADLLAPAPAKSASLTVASHSVVLVSFLLVGLGGFVSYQGLGELDVL